jgi:hypothetical protein
MPCATNGGPKKTTSPGRDRVRIFIPGFVDLRDVVPFAFEDMKRSPAESKDKVGLEDRQVMGKLRYSVLNFVPEPREIREAVAWGTDLADVANEAFVTGDSDGMQDVVEELSGDASEWLVIVFFGLARGFAYNGDSIFVRFNDWLEVGNMATFVDDGRSRRRTSSLPKVHFFLFWRFQSNVRISC